MSSLHDLRAHTEALTYHLEDKMGRHSADNKLDRHTAFEEEQGWSRPYFKACCQIGVGRDIHRYHSQLPGEGLR